MKKSVSILLAAIIASISFSACGPKCKECEQKKVMGISTGVKAKLCGDDLKKAEESGIFDCK